MPIKVRPANPEADREQLLELIFHHLCKASVKERFDWLYKENPHGPAEVWIAEDEETQKAVGCAAIFPRRLWVSGAIQKGYVLGDFCIDTQHRSLGLAIQLQRACLDGVSANATASAYDFPSERMMAIYKRLRMAPIGEIERWSKPLRAERQIGKVMKQPVLARIVAAPVNKLLAWKDLANQTSREWVIEEQQVECGEEFTRLEQKIGSAHGTCVERSAEYLNWRYFHHPLQRFQLLTARLGSELRGYVVLSQTGQDAKIVDLFGFSETAMWNALVSHVTRRVRAQAAMTLSVAILASDPRSQLLKKWGFRPREKSPVVVCGPGAAATSNQDQSPAWFLMDGDRES